MVATFVCRCLWMRSLSQKWWCHDVNGLTETDFFYSDYFYIHCNKILVPQFRQVRDVRCILM